jgi:hydrogenase maturation protease
LKTLIVGLGNPILGDDSVGWVIAQKVAETLRTLDPAVKVESYSLAGISLMEQMIGFDRVILIDSLNTGNFPPGKVVTFTLDSLVDLTNGHSASAHDLTLKKALALGRSMIADLPEDKDVHILAVEARHTYEFGEVLSPEIEAALPVAVQEVIKLYKALHVDNISQ